jgi:hypothetical protein
MSELGESVFDAIEFLTKFYKDISSLVTTVEERMSSEGLAHLYGTTAFWKRSYTYYSPTSWMPRWVARLYTVKVEESSKGEAMAPWFAFFNIYFTPKHLDEPAAVWGFGTQDSLKNLGTPLSQLLVADDGPNFLTELPVTEWEPVEDIPEQLSSFQYQARAVVELNDAQTVEELVVLPLVAHVDRLRKST